MTGVEYVGVFIRASMWVVVLHRLLLGPAPTLSLSF
jgi:hypothetical protein